MPLFATDALFSWSRITLLTAGVAWNRPAKSIPNSATTQGFGLEVPVRIKYFLTHQKYRFQHVFLGQNS